MSALPGGLSWSHPNFNDPTNCAECDADLDRDLMCPRCDVPCEVCGSEEHITDDHEPDDARVCPELSAEARS